MQRTISAVALLSLAIVALAFAPEWLNSPTPLEGWRRTVGGWEQSARWFTAQSGPPALHPAWLAMGQWLVAMWIQIASESSPRVAPKAKTG